MHTHTCMSMYLVLLVILFVGGYPIDKNADYAFVYKNKNFIFNDGDETITLRSLKIVDDNIVEGDEEFKLEIIVVNPTSVNNRYKVTGDATVLIQNDDG